LENITLIAAGVGSDVNNPELETIADDLRRVFSVSSFSNLNNITSSLGTVIEEAANGE